MGDFDADETFYEDDEDPTVIRAIAIFDLGEKGVTAAPVFNFVEGTVNMGSGLTAEQANPSPIQMTLDRLEAAEAELARLRAGVTAVISNSKRCAESSLCDAGEAAIYDLIVEDLDALLTPGAEDDR